MKNYILLAILLCTISCKKKTTPTPTPSNPNPTPQIEYNNLKYWLNDTLVGYVNASPVGYWDTLYASTVNGDNYVKYKGVQYRFKSFVMQGNTFSDSTGSYFYDLFDMSGNYITSKDSIDVTCQLHTARVYDKTYKVWDTTLQMFYPPYQPPFPKGIIAYQGLHKK